MRCSSCSAENTFPPQSQRRTARCQAPQALPSPCQVINNHHLRDTEKQAAPWEWLIAPKQKYKEPKAGHFTRIRVLPAFDLVGGRKKKSNKKVRIARKSLL